MIRRHWPTLTVLTALLVAVIGIQAQPAATPKPATPPPADAATLKEVIARQQALEKQYKNFTTNLLGLAQKLEKSDRIEDKDKAKSLRRAIDLADKEGVDNKFTTLPARSREHRPDDDDIKRTGRTRRSRSSGDPGISKR